MIANKDIQGIRDSVSDLAVALADPENSVLSDYTIAVMLVDYFEAIWPVVESALCDWSPERDCNDDGERALMDAILDADGGCEDEEDDEDEPFICDDCRAKMGKQEEDKK